MVQNGKEVCMSTDEKRADLGSFSDKTGYNNKMIFFVCFCLFVFCLFVFFIFYFFIFFYFLFWFVLFSIWGGGHNT